MSKPIDGINSLPKTKPEMSSISQGAAYASDTVTDPSSGGTYPRTANKITAYKRIEAWQNYFLCSAICSVGLKLGSGIDDFHLYANFTGDNYTYMYAAEKGNPNNLQCDSGITNYFFMPQAVKKAYAFFGYGCTYLSNEYIKSNFCSVMNAIRESIDKDIPVLAWGLLNASKDWNNYTGILPEACLIGGYDENDVLYVNLYNWQSNQATDEYGYSAISNALENIKGVFIAGKPTEKPDTRQLYKSVIDSIPAFLTLPPAENENGRYVFGKAAFEVWADTLEDDSFFENKTDGELGVIRWNLHCSPYCCVCTSTAYDFLKKAAAQYPDLEMAAKLAPLYDGMKRCKDDIWALQSGFEPPLDKLRTHEFRAQIADILRKMGDLCDTIISAFVTVA